MGPLCSRFLALLAVAACITISTAHPATAISEDYEFEGCEWRLSDTSLHFRAKTEVRDLNGGCRRLRAWVIYDTIHGERYRSTPEIDAPSVEATSGDDWALWIGGVGAAQAWTTFRWMHRFIVHPDWPW